MSVAPVSDHDIEFLEHRAKKAEKMGVEAASDMLRLIARIREEQATAKACRTASQTEALLRQTRTWERDREAKRADAAEAKVAAVVGLCAATVPVTVEDCSALITAIREVVAPKRRRGEPDDDR